MKKSFILALIFCLSAQTFAVGIEDLPVYKENGARRSELQNFWEKFKRSQLTSKDSGGAIAAELLLSEAEYELEAAGFSADEIKNIRADANILYAKEKQETEIRIAKIQTGAFAGDFEKYIDPDNQSLLTSFIADHPQYLDAYKALRKEIDGFKDFSSIYPWAYRFITGLLVLSILESQQFDFKRKPGRKLIDIQLENMDRFAAEVAVMHRKVNNLLPIVAPPAPITLDGFGKTVERIQSAWKSRHWAIANTALLRGLGGFSSAVGKTISKDPIFIFPTFFFWGIGGLQVAQGRGTENAKMLIIFFSAMTAVFWLFSFAKTVQHHFPDGITKPPVRTYGLSLLGRCRARLGSLDSQIHIPSR